MTAKSQLQTPHPIVAARPEWLRTERAADAESWVSWNPPEAGVALCELHGLLSTETLIETAELCQQLWDSDKWLTWLLLSLNCVGSELPGLIELEKVLRARPQSTGLCVHVRRAMGGSVVLCCSADERVGGATSMFGDWTMTVARPVLVAPGSDPDVDVKEYREAATDLLRASMPGVNFNDVDLRAVHGEQAEARGILTWLVEFDAYRLLSHLQDTTDDVCRDE